MNLNGNHDNSNKQNSLYTSHTICHYTVSVICSCITVLLLVIT